METNKYTGANRGFLYMERNASWKGQILGVIAFYILFRVTPLLVIVLFTLIFGDGHYMDVGMFLGIILGCVAYYKIIQKFQKK